MKSREEPNKDEASLAKRVMIGNYIGSLVAQEVLEFSCTLSRITSKTRLPWEPIDYEMMDSIARGLYTANQIDDLISLTEEFRKYERGEPIDLPLIIRLLLAGGDCAAELLEDYSVLEAADAGAAQKGKISDQRRAQYERCFREIHNQEIKQGYKGTGQGSPLSHFVANCPELKKQKKNVKNFNPDYRLWKSELPGADKRNSITVKGIACCFGCDYCEKRHC